MTLCQSRACTRRLDASQEERGARYCRPACRVAEHRARRAEEREAYVDALLEALDALAAPAIADDYRAVLALADDARALAAKLR